MPLATACRTYPYPEDADPIDVAGDIQRLAAAIDVDICALMDAVERAPVGTVRMTIRQVADPGWAFFGATLANADTLYPEFWAIAPVAWRSGTTLIIPSMADRVPTGVGSNIVGTPAGANSRTLISANLPPHQHTIDHGHPAFTDPDGIHSHNGGTDSQGSHNHGTSPLINGGGAFAPYFVSGGPNQAGTIRIGPQNAGQDQLFLGVFDGTTFNGAHAHSISTNNSPSHIHTVRVTAAVSQLSGTGGFANQAVDIRSASMALNFEIRVVP